MPKLIAEIDIDYMIDYLEFKLAQKQVILENALDFMAKRKTRKEIRIFGITLIRGYTYEQAYAIADNEDSHWHNTSMAIHLAKYRKRKVDDLLNGCLIMKKKNVKTIQVDITEYDFESYEATK